MELAPIDAKTKPARARARVDARIKLPELGQQARVVITNVLYS